MEKGTRDRRGNKQTVEHSQMQKQKLRKETELEKESFDTTLRTLEAHAYHEPLGGGCQEAQKFTVVLGYRGPCLKKKKNTKQNKQANKKHQNGLERWLTG